MNRLLLPIVAVAGVLAGVVNADAQSYPSRQITIVVGFPPGGPTDLVARVIADKMRTSFNQTVIVENVPGAAGSIGGGRVAAAAPDGYTLLVGQWTTQVGAGAIYPLKYHVMDDFTPIGRLTESYLWLLGRKDLPPNNVKEFVAYAKANPGKLTAASAGAGSAGHICIVDFAARSGTDIRHIPYRGGAQVIQDLVGGQVDSGCVEASQTLPQYRAGNVKNYGVVAKKRWPSAPDIPTVAEAGGPEADLTFWHGLWGPKGMPQEIVARLNAVVREAFADPAVQERFTKAGHVIPPAGDLSPEALARHHKAEIDKWWPVIKAAGVTTQ